MKKAQMNYFLIVGILVVIAMAATVYYTNLPAYNTLKTQSSSLSISLNGQNFQEVFDKCSTDAVLRANLNYGLPKNNNQEYSAFLDTEIKSCVDGIIDTLTEQGYDVEKGALSNTVEINDNTVVVTSKYPITLVKDGSTFTFSEHVSTFGRITSISLDGGNVNEDVTVNSPDNSARLVLKAGTKVTDDKGNPIEIVSLRIEDVHFEGMSNSAVVGNLVYEGLPKGAQFSKPVELYMRIRAQDKPMFMADEELSLAYFNEEYEFWEALPSFVTEDGLIGTKDVEHFTMFAVVTGCPKGVNTYFETPELFKQRYSYMSNGYDSMDSTLLYPKDPNEFEDVEIGMQDSQEPDFCTDSARWFEDKKAIIPSDKDFLDYLKYQKESEGFMGSSIYDTKGFIEQGYFESLAANTLKYGGSSTGICKDNANENQEVEVEPYVCCHDFVCLNELKSRQECLSAFFEAYENEVYSAVEGYSIEEGSNFKLIKLSEADDKKYSFVDSFDEGGDILDMKEVSTQFTQPSSFKRKLTIGYEDGICIGGNVEGDYENAMGTKTGIVYKIYLQGEGKQCLRTFSENDDQGKQINVELKLINNYGTCSLLGKIEKAKSFWGMDLNLFVEDELKTINTYDDYGSFLGIPELEISTESYCADCKGALTFKDMQVSLENEGTCEIIYETASGKPCGPTDKSGVNYKNSQTYMAGEECIKKLTECESTFTCDEKEAGNYKIIYDYGEPYCMVCGKKTSTYVTPGMGPNAQDTEDEVSRYVYGKEKISGQVPTCDENGCGSCLDFGAGICTEDLKGNVYCDKGNNDGRVCDGKNLVYLPETSNPSDYGLVKLPKELCFDCANLNPKPDDCTQIDKFAETGDRV